MTAAEQILDNVIAWGTREPNVRRLVLVGSRAANTAPDDLADIDVQVYTENVAAYTESGRWLSDLGEVWLCVRDEYVDEGIHVPTRLVIFSGGVKVDFAFYPAGPLSSLTAGLAHRMLVNKTASRLHTEFTAPAPEEPPPTEAEFRGVVDEFWFEAYHVAKYLAREELWLAKSRDAAAKQFLMRMIGWHERFARGNISHRHAAGTRRSMSSETWQALHAASAGADAGDSWRATMEAMRLFRRVATETAAALRFPYRIEVDENLSRLIGSIRQRTGGRTAPLFRALRSGPIVLHLVTEQNVDDVRREISAHADADHMLREFDRSYLPRFDGYGRRTKWGFYATLEGDLAGLSLLGVSSWEHLRGYTGADTLTPMRGRGVAPASKPHLFFLGFQLLGLNRIETGCSPSNVASRRSIEKTPGFMFEGVLRENGRLEDGAFEDELRFAILRHDWARLYDPAAIDLIP